MITLYQQDIDCCLDSCVGAQGVTRLRLEELTSQLSPAVRALAARQNKAAAPLLDSAAGMDDISAIETVAAELCTRFNTFVVAGLGGSGLSGRTLTMLKRASVSSFHFLENIDPDDMDELLAQIDVERTCFLVISKSGTTAETLSQYYILLEHVERKLGKKVVGERFVVITMPGVNPLRTSAVQYGMRVLDHDPHIGGRFAVLTLVGLLPAAIAGLDIKALRRGARSVIRQLDTAAESHDIAPALGAALQYAFIEKKVPMTVMLPYSEKLSAFSSWYRQIWAESLGKQGKGSTPVRAAGVTDQHSQLQLYLDGPKDKLFTMVLVNRTGSGPRIAVPDGIGLDYLCGKTLGDVMAAEQKATVETLVQNRCPVRLLQVEKLDEEHMGALLMHFMLEVILVAWLLGVDPFDQPAVEQGKILARDYLLMGKL